MIQVTDTRLFMSATYGETVYQEVECESIHCIVNCGFIYSEGNGQCDYQGCVTEQTYVYM